MGVMISWLIDPLQYGFMVQAIAIAALLGVLCAVIGTYLLVQQMAMIGNMISHAVVPGLSIALFWQIDLSIGAFVAGLLSALTVAGLNAQSRIKPDAAIALVLSGFLALGIVLIKLLRTNQINLEYILFGNILGVTQTDLWQTLIITGVVLAMVKLFYKELLFYTFDPLGAKASGLPVSWLYLGLVSAITLAITASMQVVGVLLVVSLLVAPSATAYLLVRELHWMMVLGAALGIVSGVSGLYLSYYWDLPSGPAIVLVSMVLFGLVFCFSPSQGVLVRREVWRSVWTRLLMRFQGSTTK